MQSLGLQNVAGNRITVTTVATSLLSLIDTACGGVQNLPANLDAINIYVEDGNVRILSNGNTPTASIGLLLKKGALYQLRGLNLNFLKLISAGSSSVVLNIEIGIANEDETSGGMDASTTGGVFNITDPSLVNGQSTEFQFNSRGDLKVELNQPLADEDLVNKVSRVEHQYQATHIATATTTVVRAVAGFLHSVTVNTTAAGLTTIYNNSAASGAVIAILPASVLPQTFFYDVDCPLGITIVTAAASDLTVSSR